MQHFLHTQHLPNPTHLQSSNKRISYTVCQTCDLQFTKNVDRDCNLIQTMSLVPGVKDIDMHNPVIDNLIQSSLPNEYDKLEWIPCSQITGIKPTQISTVHYAYCSLLG